MALIALGWLWAPFGAVVAAAVCVASVALADMDLHFAWQAWHLVTSTFTLRGRCGAWRHRRGCLRGRRGTWRHRLPLCVAGVALGDIDLHFWHLATSTVTLRGRRGTWRHRPPPIPPFHPQHFHTRLFPRHHFYTPRLYFTHTSFTNNTFTRNSFTHLPSTYISCTHRSSTISFLFPACYPVL